MLIFLSSQVVGRKLLVVSKVITSQCSTAGTLGFLFLRQEQNEKIKIADEMEFFVMNSINPEGNTLACIVAPSHSQTLAQWKKRNRKRRRMSREKREWLAEARKYHLADCRDGL